MLDILVRPLLATLTATLEATGRRMIWTFAAAVVALAATGLGFAAGVLATIPHTGLVAALAIWAGVLGLLAAILALIGRRPRVYAPVVPVAPPAATATAQNPGSGQAASQPHGAQSQSNPGQGSPGQGNQGQAASGDPMFDMGRTVGQNLPPITSLAAIAVIGFLAGRR